MKTILASIAVLLIGVCTPASAWEMDITNHPDKDFLLGYKRSYLGDCDVHWWASQWGTQHIFALGECKGISGDRMYDDMIKLMEHVRATTDHENFSEYFREGDRIAREHTTPETLAMAEIPLRCLDTASGTYIFLPAKAHNRPGWYYLDKVHNSRRLSSSIVGLWKQNKNGALIADLGLQTISVNMANVYRC